MKPRKKATYCGYTGGEPALEDKEIIYTHEEASEIVGIFEDVLDRYGISVPSPEDDERGDDNGAKLYGSTYGDLLDDVEALLIDIISRVRRGADVVKYVFPGNAGEENCGYDR